MYDGGYGPTNEKLQRYLARLFAEESAQPIAMLHDPTSNSSSSSSAG